MATAAGPLLILDYRTPGQTMATLPLKIPRDAADQLQALADRLQTSRAAVARALLLQGLAELDQAAAAKGVG